MTAKGRLLQGWGKYELTATPALRKLTAITQNHFHPETSQSRIAMNFGVGMRFVSKPAMHHRHQAVQNLVVTWPKKVVEAKKLCLVSPRNMYEKH